MTQINSIKSHNENGKSKTLYNKRIQKYQLVHIADTKRPKRMCET